MLETPDRRGDGSLQGEAVSVAETPLEPQGRGEAAVVATLPDQPADRPGLRPEGSLPAVLGLQEFRLGGSLPEAMAVVGQPSRLEPFRRFARLIPEYLDGIRRWTELRVAHRALEGMSSKIKIFRRLAYGFREVDAYVTAVCDGCGYLPPP